MGTKEGVLRENSPQGAESLKDPKTSGRNESLAPKRKRGHKLLAGAVKSEKLGRVRGLQNQIGFKQRVLVGLGGQVLNKKKRKKKKKRGRKTIRRQREKVRATK